jgi:hypothetical protein
MIAVKKIWTHLETLWEIRKPGLIFYPLNGRPCLIARRINANQEFDVVPFGHLFCKPQQVNRVAHIDLPHPHYAAAPMIGETKAITLTDLRSGFGEGV